MGPIVFFPSSYTDMLVVSALLHLFIMLCSSIKNMNLGSRITSVTVLAVELYWQQLVTARYWLAMPGSGCKVLAPYSYFYYW
jgi:hypothetical protein